MPEITSVLQVQNPFETSFRGLLPTIPCDAAVLPFMAIKYKTTIGIVVANGRGGMGGLPQ
jgi:hypothetical protein